MGGRTPRGSMEEAVGVFLHLCHFSHFSIPLFTADWLVPIQSRTYPRRCFMTDGCCWYSLQLFSCSSQPRLLWGVLQQEIGRNISSKNSSDTVCSINVAWQQESPGHRREGGVVRGKIGRVRGRQSGFTRPPPLHLLHWGWCRGHLFSVAWFHADKPVCSTEGMNLIRHQGGSGSMQSSEPH